MGKVYEAIDEQLGNWIDRQSLFFVATAPLTGHGHVNLSPKGPIGTLRVLGPHELAYLDLIGSGAETIAHLRENGRIADSCGYGVPPTSLRRETGTPARLGLEEAPRRRSGGVSRLSAREERGEPRRPASGGS